MIYSIYSFFRSIVQKKELFKTVQKLDQFPFDENLLACKNVGVFPDLAIRLNDDKKIFTGGELIELKDSVSYNVSSFNSTIPSRSKKIAEIIAGENSAVKSQMEKAGNDIFSLPVRDIYYLVRGKKKERVKVCLVYGSFFETIGVETLISQSFLQVLEERLKETGKQINDELKQTLVSVFSKQQSFSKVRDVDKSSVKVNIQIIAEVKAEGNILNAKKYPEIEDDTLNFVVPCDDERHEQDARKKFGAVFSEKEIKGFNILKIKHHFNGYFLVFQIKM